MKGAPCRKRFEQTVAAAGLVPFGMLFYNTAMKRLTLSLSARLMIVLALTMAMVSGAWAHRIAPVDYDESLSAYLLAGGTLDTLCTDADGTEHDGLRTCDACRLVDTAALSPAQVACLGALPVTDVPALPAAGRMLPVALWNPQHPARAPPAV